MQEKEFDMIGQIIRIVILKNNKSVTDILKKENSYGFVIFVGKCQKAEGFFGW